MAGLRAIPEPRSECACAAFAGADQRGGDLLCGMLVQTLEGTHGPTSPTDAPVGPGPSSHAPVRRSGLAPGGWAPRVNGDRSSPRRCGAPSGSPPRWIAAVEPDGGGRAGVTDAFSRPRSAWWTGSTRCAPNGPQLTCRMSPTPLWRMSPVIRRSRSPRALARGWPIGVSQPVRSLAVARRRPRWIAASGPDAGPPTGSNVPNDLPRQHRLCRRSSGVRLARGA